MAPENWEHPYEPIDETTAARERSRAEARLETARTGEARTLEVVGLIRGSIGAIRALHQENHFTERALDLYRGTHKHAS